MASPPAGLAQKIDAQLVCPICSDRYKIPKVLVCLHSFCQECLEKLFRHSLRPSIRSTPETNPPINCPVCRCATDVPSNGVEGLPTNFTLSNIVEVMDIHDTEGEKASSSGKTCENGLDSNPAVVHCLDCKSFLCQNCLELHKKMKVTKNHRCVSLREIKEDVRKMEHKRYCAEHEDEELRLYCKTCREVICRDCTIVTHKTHDYTFIKDVKDELVKEMQQLLDKVKAKEVEFAGHQAHLQKVESMNKENVDQCRQMVSQFFAEWIQRLHAKEEDLLHNIEVRSGKISKCLMSENDAVNLMIGQMGSAIKFTRQLLDSGTPVDIAMMSKYTCKQLNLVQQLEWDPKSVIPRKYSFIGNDTNPLTANVCEGNFPDEIVVEGLDQPTLGENTFNIRVLGEVGTGVAVVTVEDANGEKVGNPQVKTKGVREWTATYNILRDGHYKISVSVNGVEAKGGPFKRVWMNQLPIGTKVRRGRDWKWGNQDRGLLGVGKVTERTETWVKVTWDNGNSNRYRWGDEGYFDLEIVPCE